MICTKFRGILLLSFVGKVFTWFVLKRLQQLAERVYPDLQCGFRAQVYHWHDLHTETTAVEVPGTEAALVYLYKFDEGI